MTATKYKPKVGIACDSESLARRSLELFVADAKKAIGTKDVFYVAISGGHTPKRFFELLGETAESKVLPWNKVHLFWVDERDVLPDSQMSNYKLAADTFLSKVNLPEENIHRILTGYSDLKVAAMRYEKTIRKVFNLKTGQIPKFDLIVLGLGSDGHTASLFSGSSTVFDDKDLVCSVSVAGKDVGRITLTAVVLCAATHLVVLVGGKEKAGILKKVLTSEPDKMQYPIHVLWPVLDKVTWVVDSDAAKLL